MEVRCGKCNKLFRVSDDKITGRGVKFACTRCGDFVKITRDEFESYALAQSAVSALDLFQSEAAFPAEPAAGPESATAGLSASLPSAGEVMGAEEGTGREDKTGEPPATTVPDFLQEREEPLSPEPYPFEEPSPMMEQPPLEEPVVPSKPAEEEGPAGQVKEPEAPKEPEATQEPVISAKPEQEPAPEPEPIVKTEPEFAQKPGPGSEAVSEQKPAATAETTAGMRAGAGPAFQARPAAQAVSAPSGAAAAEPPKGPVRQAGTMPPKAAKAAAPPEKARSGRLLIVMLAAFLVAGLAWLASYLYVRPSQPTAVKKPVTAMVTIEGLQIVNPAGSLDANGDLLVSGTLENTTDRERADWYIVVDVFDAGGKSVNSIRMMNGKQIYTRRDYDILAKRGANVQELKEKALQPRGVVLPPRGKTAFEVRYLQPPDGIASFNATLQPFDPARLLKEIEGETR